MAGNTYDDFLAKLRELEGSTNYTVENPQHYLGAYQMGEEALTDAGLYKGDKTPKINDWQGGWTEKAHAMGIKSPADFIAAKVKEDGSFETVEVGKKKVKKIVQDPSKIENARKAQDEAVQVFHKDAWRIICHNNLDIHVGKTYNGIENTESGLIAGYHLVGLGKRLKSGKRRYGLKDYLQSEGKIIPTDGKDNEGTPITKYLKELGGYEVPFKVKPRIQSPAPVRVGTSKNLGVSPALPQGVAPPQPLRSIRDRWPWDSNTYDDGLADRWKNMMP